MTEPIPHDWLKNIPCLSKRLEKQVAQACQNVGFSKELVAEVDEVIKAACIEIAKRLGRDILICPNCGKLVCPREQYLEQHFCYQCGTWFEEQEMP